VTLAVAISGLIPASAASTNKKLSSNFTLVNLDNGANGGTIAYIKPDGTEWKAAEPFNMTTLGEQIVKRQYDPNNGLSAGRGSVVVTSDGPLGAVVQIQARDGQVPSFGAYSGVSDGASSVGIPVVIRRRTTASGPANSQIVVQNAGSTAVNIEIDLIDSADGVKDFTKTANIAPSAAFEYDLESETNLPEQWVGSAVIRALSGGEVAVVSNLFSGPDSMQTFNGFPQTTGAASTAAAQKWFVPLFTSRLPNNLSTPVSVQNVSGGEIGVGAIVMTCKPDRPGLTDPLILSNTTAVKNTASYSFNPVIDQSIPTGWRGSCIVTTTGFPTNAFVQMRVVNPNDALDPLSQAAGAYDAIATGDDIVVFPLFAKRLNNGFSSAITIQNLNESAAATVDLVYKAGSETPRPECSLTLTNQVIQPGQNLVQNLRLESANPPIPDSVPALGDNCQGTLTVTSKNGQAINGFVQLTIVTSLNPALANGDTFQAHNAFTLSN
jgi:hypothetical protein